MNKVVFTTIGLIVAAAIVGVLLVSSDESPDTTASQQTDTQTAQLVDNQEQSIDIETAAQSLTERYVDYSPEKLADSTTDKNVLFFHAAWCTVCNSVERAIEAGVVPENLTIFKIDFDSDIGQELARKYAIPIQYTSVQVDRDGNELKQWVNQFNDGPLDMLAQTVDAG